MGKKLRLATGFIFVAFLVSLGILGSQPANAAGHTSHTYGSWSTTTAATCESAAIQTRQCTYVYPGGTRCGVKQTQSYGSPLNHSYGGWSQDQAAGCETYGQKHRTCSRCKKIDVQKISPTGHSIYTESKSANCTDGGYVRERCRNCTYSKTTSSTGALGHSFNESNYTTISAPTCTGYGTGKCVCQRSGCSATKGVNISPIGHDIKKDSKSATCTEAGYVKEYCARSSCTYRNTVSTTPAKGHSYNESQYTVIKAPTCDEYGTGKCACVNCGTTNGVTLQPLGHEIKTNRKNPTCTENGYLKEYCTRDNCSYVKSDTVLNATGHKYDETVYTTIKAPGCEEYGTGKCACIYCGSTKGINLSPVGHDIKTNRKNPTCTEGGYVKEYCARDNCSYVKSNTVLNATGHKYDESKYTTIKAPGCEEYGTGKCACIYCGATKGVNISPLGHDIKTDRKNPTCTEAGYVKEYCARAGCSYVKSNTVLSATGHKYDETKYTVVKAAKCEEYGTGKCSCLNGCGTTKGVTISPLGHDIRTDGKAATCTEDGYGTVKCVRDGCSYVKSSGVITATGHKYDETKYTVVKAAGCEEYGTGKCRCLNCGLEKGINLNPLGHDMKCDKKDATCTENGYVKEYCARSGCNYVKTNTVLNATGHKYDETKYTVVKAAKCEEYGSGKCSCLNCGATKGINIKPLGHDIIVDTKPATCMGDGYVKERCSREGCNYVKSNTLLKATGHKYDETKYTVVKAAGCEEYGTGKCSCLYCGATKGINIKPLGHDIIVDTKPATCTENGYVKEKCSRNGCTYVKSTTVLNAIGHNFDETKYTVIKNPTCVEAGTGKCFCKNCGASKGVNLKAFGHDVREDRLEPTCTTDGYIKQRCFRTNCSYVESSTVLNATGHRYDESDYITVKAPTCEGYGTGKCFCLDCGAAKGVNIQPIGHVMEFVQKDPTCINPGYSKEKCVRPACTYVGQSILIPATGYHVYGEWELEADESTDTLEVYYKHCTTPGCTNKVKKLVEKTAEPEPDNSKYYVEYWGNGGIGIVPNTYFIAKEATVEKNGFNKTGYIFCYWNTDPNENGVRYHEGDVIRRQEEPIRLYAIWYPIEYNVTFNINAEGLKNPSTLVVNYDDKSYQFPIPKRDGYTFTGWTGIVNGKKTTFSADSLKNNATIWNLTDKDGDTIAFTAGWKQNDDHVVVSLYDGSTLNSKLELDKGEKKKLPKIEKYGADNLGWTTKKNGKVVEYELGTKYSFTGNTTLYAVWPEFYSVQFYDGYTYLETKFAAVDTKIKTGERTRNGVDSIGWSTTQGSKKAEYKNNTKYAFNKDLKLYAVWNETYDVKFYDGDVYIETRSAEVGTKVRTGKQVKNGQIANGWSTSKNGKVQYDNNTRYNFGKDTTLYAVWDQYTITYHANGGTNAPKSQSAYQGEFLTLTKNQPNRTGYSFQGWSETSGTEQTVDYKSGDDYELGLTKTLYAVWRPIDYTVKYNYGYDGKSATKNAKYDLEFMLKTPSKRTGYEFLGWKGYSEGKPLSYSADTVKTTLVKNLATKDKSVVTLTAQWKKLDNYCTVSLYNNGKLIKTETVKKGKSYTLPYQVDEKDVKGWTKVKNGTSADIKPGRSVKINEDSKFYAVWNDITIKFDANGGTGAPDSRSGSASGITIPKTEPKRDGYVFNGWWVKNLHNWEAADFQPGDTYNLGYSATLTAVWLPITYSYLKEKFQKEYPSIMKDKYFTEEYTSSSWQRINDHKYFIIKTWKLSKSQYESELYMIYKDGDTIKLVDYGDKGNILQELKIDIIENSSNDVNRVFKVVTVTVDIAEDFVVEKATGFVKGKISIVVDAIPGAAEVVEAYNAAKGAYSFTKKTVALAKEWIDSPLGGKTMFDTVDYTMSNAKRLDLEFLINPEFSYGEAKSIVGKVKSCLEQYINGNMEINIAEDSNIDPYGDRDYAITTFKSRIQASGFGSGVYGSGLSDIIEKIYGSPKSKKQSAAAAPVTLDYLPSSGDALTSTPGKTTTILGRYDIDTKSILEELDLPETVGIREEENGFLLLNVPEEAYAGMSSDEFFETYNKPFLDAVLARKDVIIFATEITEANLKREDGTSSTYEKEIEYIKSKGYRIENNRVVYD